MKKLKVLWVVSLVGMVLFFGLSKVEFSSTSLPLANVVQIKCKIISPDYYSYRGWQGSGVFIEDNLILTAGHIVDGIVDANVITIDGKEYEALSWYLETEVDIGFIEVKTIKVERKLDFDKAKLGEAVWTYGNPLGVFPVLTKGIVSAVSAVDDYGNTKNMVITDSAINGGNSGCPLFDIHGNILGICSWGYTNSQGMNYFVKASVIKLSLKKYKAIKALEDAK